MKGGICYSQQAFLDNHVARVPFSLNQQGFVQTWYELLPSVGAQKMDTSGYQVSAQENIEFHWEAYQTNTDTVFWSGIDTPFSPSTFNELEMTSAFENPFLIENEKDK